MWGMGKKEVVTITDDIDGRAGAETVTFAYAGRSYEVDLGEKNRAKLEKALEPFIAAARKADGSRQSRRSAGGTGLTGGRGDLQAVRIWAIEQGYQVSGRGRLSKKVVEA